MIEIEGRRFELKSNTNNIIRVEVTFDAPPVSPVVLFAPAKYNKEIVFNYEQDDSQVGIYDIVFKHFHGGTAFDGVTSPGLTYTDGCGNNLKWKAAAACFCINSFGVDLMSGVTGYLTYNKMYEMLQNDWDVMNHQFGALGSDYKLDSDRYQQIRDLSQRVWEQMLDRGMQYRIRTMVNPAADEGYTFTGFNTKMRLFSSQAGVDSLKDGYTYIYNRLLSSLNIPNMAIARDYLGEDFTTDLIADWSTLINTIKTTSTSSNPKVLRMFSHGPYVEAPSAEGFRTFVDYISDEFGDRVWVPTSTELYEYIETKTLAVKTQNVVDNKLIIGLDISAIPPENRRRDMSLLVSGGTITNVTATGVDDFSFNTTTGLINIFKKKITGFVQPIDDLEPPRIVTAKYNSGAPNQVKLTYNIPVTQSIASAYTINTEYDILSLTGSGDTWYLNLSSPVTEGINVTYRGQDGDVMAVDTSNDIRGTSTIGLIIEEEEIITPIIIGTGSGNLTISPTTTGAVAGDIILVTAGSYDNIIVRDFNIPADQPKVQIVNGGVVLLENAAINFINNSGVYMRGDYVPGIEYGFQFSDVAYRAITMETRHTRFWMKSMSFDGVADYCVYRDAGLRDQPYLNTDETMSEDIKFLNMNFNNCGGIYWGGTLDFANSRDWGFTRDVEVAYCINTNTAGAGEYHKFENTQDYNIHHNTADNLNTTNNNHNSVFLMVGNGDFHHNKFSNYQGNSIRARIYSRGTTPRKVRIYNNICNSTRKYSGFEVQSFPYYLSGGITTWAYAEVFHNTVYNMHYMDNTGIGTGNYFGVVLDKYEMAGSIVSAWNNVGVHFLYPAAEGADYLWGQGDPDFTYPDSNRYYNELDDAGLTEDGQFRVLTGSPLIAGDYRVNPYIIDDYYGNPRTGVPTVGAVQYIS